MKPLLAASFVRRPIGTISSAARLLYRGIISVSSVKYIFWSGSVDEARSNASHVYAMLRRGIIRCEFEPGAKIKIAELSASLAVSPGAVREALSRLSTERLVVAEDQRGFRAATITVAELDDLTDARVEIECLMLARAITNQTAMSAEWLRQTIAALTSYRGDPTSPAAATLHADLHAALVSTCGSETLLRVRSSLYEMSQRYRFLAMRSVDFERNTDGEHRAIVEASLAGDVARACDEMSRHIRKTADIVKSIISAGVPARDAASHQRPPLVSTTSSGSSARSIA